MLKSKCYQLISSLHNQSFDRFFSKDKIFHSDNKNKTILKFQNFKMTNVKIQDTSNSAAVLIPLCIVDEQLSLLFTLRSTGLKSYRGHVSFPGGHKDKIDENLEETMYRETFEELGINKDTIDLWTHGNFIMANNGKTPLMPFLGFIGNIQLDKLNINKSEVEAVFAISLSNLSDSRYNGYTHFRDYVLPVYIGGLQRVWGLTALLTHMTLKSLLSDDIYNLQLKPLPKLYKK